MTVQRGRWATSSILVVSFLLVAAVVSWGQEATPGVNQHFIEGVRLVKEGMYQEAVTELQAATGEDPELEPAWHYLGVAQFHLGNLQEAVAALQRAIEITPNRPETRLYIGRIYEQLGAYDQAVAAYQEELRLRIGRSPTEAYNALARGYYLAGRYREAIEAAYQATLRDPNYVEALYNWGRAEDAQGNPDAAIRRFEQAKQTLGDWMDLQTRLQRLTDELRSDPEITEERVVQEYGHAEEFAIQLGLWPELNKALGQAAIHAGKYAVARNSFRAALDPAQLGNPDDPEASTLIGAAYYHDARDLLFEEDLLFMPIQVLSAANKALEAALQKRPDYAPAHNALGEVYLLQAETFVSDPTRKIVSHTFEEAEGEFARALEIDPQYVDAMLNLAKAYSGQQRYQEAAQQLTAALSLASDRADLHAQLARTYVALEDFARAKEESATAIQLDKKEVTAYNAAGLAAYYAGDLGEAVESFRRAVDLDPTRHESHTNLGLAYFQMRSWNRARDEFKAALKYLPEAVITNTAIQRSYLLYLVALTYSNIGLHDEAVASLNEALAIDPTYFEALRQLARDFASLADYRAAERALRRALQQSPGPIEDADVLSQLGLVYETAGQPHQALAAYSEAITKDPNNAAAQKGFARLQAF